MQAISSFCAESLSSLGTALIVWAARSDCPACVCRPSVTCAGGGSPKVLQEGEEAGLPWLLILTHAGIFIAGLLLGAAGQLLWGPRAPASPAPVAAARPAAFSIEDEAREQAAAARARSATASSC